MKKALIFATFAACVLCSCAKNSPADVSSDVPLALAPYSSRTKASATDVTTLEGTATGADANHAGFGVYAFYQPSTDGTPVAYKTTNSPDFMSNQKVSWNGTASAWTYSPVKYWPNNKGDQLSFIAFSPCTNTTDEGEIAFTFAAGATEDAKASLSLFKVNNDVLKQEDFIFASSLNNAKPKYDANTTLDFKHQLARIGFKVATCVDVANPAVEPLAENTTITIKSINFGKDDSNTGAEALSFYTSGSLTWDKEGNTSWSVASDNAKQAFPLNKDSHFITANYVLTSANTSAALDLNKTDSYLMVIPQDFSSTAFPITVVYDVETVDSSNSNNNSTITNTISQTVNVKFEKGKAYTFTLYLGMTSVKFDVAVTPWEDVTAQEVDVPANVTA